MTILRQQCEKEKKVNSKDSLRELKTPNTIVKKGFEAEKKNSSKNSNIRIITFRIFGNSNCQKNRIFTNPNSNFF